MADDAQDTNRYDEHDQAVMDRINRYISAANQKMPNGTVAEKLEYAWSQNIEERNQDPTDTVGRDADYYFAARHIIAADKSQFGKYIDAAIGLVAWPVYSALKLGTEAIGHPEIMRADKDKPNAPVGGFFWMNRGSEDGFKDRGEDNSDVILHLPQYKKSSDGMGKVNIPVS